MSTPEEVAGKIAELEAEVRTVFLETLEAIKSATYDDLVSLRTVVAKEVATGSQNSSAHELLEAIDAAIAARWEARN